MRTAVYRGWILLGALALPGGAASAPAGDAQVIEQLSRDWTQAIADKDRDRLEAILAPGFVLMMPGDPPSARVDRATWIGNAIDMDWSGFRYEQMDVQVHGDHAVASSKLHFRVSPFPFAFDSGVVDEWEKRNGRWQVTARMLGESQTKGRIAFAMGLLAAVAAYGAWRLIRRGLRRRA